MGTPTLCIEILSKSTRSKDMVDKLNTYLLSIAKQGMAAQSPAGRVIFEDSGLCAGVEYGGDQMMVLDDPLP